MIIDDLLKDFIDLLEKLEIPWMLSGSLALNIYTVPRSTRDIDIIAELKEHDLHSFISGIKDLYYYNEQTIQKEISEKGMFNIIHLASGYKIDIILRSDDEFEQTKFRNRKTIDFSGLKINIISPEDLLISKLRWIQILESDLQKGDIKSLLSYKNLDLNYIKYWIDRLNLKTYNLI